MLVVEQVNTVVEELIPAVGAVVLLVIVICAEAVQPFAGSVTVTVYAPAEFTLRAELDEASSHR